MEVVSSSTHKQTRPEPSSSLKKSPSGEQVGKIIQAFNTWAFKREQPSDLALLRRFVTRALMRQQPLSFVLYWGKGPRCAVESYDTQCLDYLASFAARIRSAYHPGAAISLVLTDTHATLNGHCAHEITRYFGEVEGQAQQRGFDCYLLGELVEAAGRGFDVEGCEPSEEMLRQLARSAMRWYRGSGTPEQGAKDYYAMNMREKRVIEHFFPASIFATFNGRELRDLFPDSLPIFYMYSLKRGTSVKPWFLPEPVSTPLAC